MSILTLNAGSSSLKFAIFEPGSQGLVRQLSGEVEGIGATDGRRLRTQSPEGEEAVHAVPEAEDHRAAFRIVWDQILTANFAEPEAVGHRVVHGGREFAAPVRVTKTVVATLKKLIPLAPLHLPPQISLIEAVTECLPETSQVACFDTAIHRSLPEVAARFPLPQRFWEAGIRKYGFHGLSYESVLATDPTFREGNTIIAHLGNGASLTAFQEGVSVETTMGLTPTGGIMMGTRTGDLDPGVLLHLLRNDGLSTEELDELVNQQSGLQGVSGMTRDVRELLAASDYPPARLAMDMFCYQIAKAIGGLATTTNGIDRLIFTGGIGEHSPQIRSLVCSRLAFLGIMIDPSRNDANDDVISRPESEIAVHVVNSNEEQIIAGHTERLISGKDSRT